MHGRSQVWSTGYENMDSPKIKPPITSKYKKLKHPIIAGLKDKKVLITGATGGIGSCLVRMFASEGATVGIHYHQNQEQAKSLTQSIEADGGRAECFKTDLLSTNAPSLIHDFIEKFSGIDVLVNNAGGILGFKDFLELDETSWNETQRLNVQAPFFLAQQAFSHMKEHGGGKIINISSIAAKYGFSNAVKFLISKGADKEHFTNEHHTPLSLAVSQNHLKVVQILFEDWISPNSHEEPYLHLSPIFNVKSKEIAQLLIDNDAVTHEIYNDKNQSPLTVACQNGYLDVVEFFLDDGLDINHLDNDNKTSLFYALTNKHEDVAKLLISKGAHK